MPCFPATVQAPVKEYCRPAVWMPGAKKYHSHSEWYGNVYTYSLG